MSLPILTYKSVWLSVTNSPSLVDGIGTLGDAYHVNNINVAGTAVTDFVNRNLGSGTKSFINGDYIYYDGSIWKIVGDPETSPIPPLTTGSVIFSNGSTLSQDNSNFFWDDLNNRLGIDGNTPTAPVHLKVTGLVPNGVIVENGGMGVTTGGLFGFGTYTLLTHQSNGFGRLASSESLSIVAQGNINFQSNSTGVSYMSFATFAEVMRLTWGLNVLIGTATDNGIDKLQVSGSVQASQLNLPGSTSGILGIKAAAVTTNYAITMPAADGTSGYVLSTNGSGILSWIPAGSGGTVTSITIATANGFAGSSSGGSTPALTLSTTITGILKGSGTAISAAVVADYPTFNQNTTGTSSNVTGTVAIAHGGTNLVALGTALQILRTNTGVTALEYVTLNTGIVPESGNLYSTNARSIGATLTGYSSGAGTISATDTILQAIQKLNGNVGALLTGVSSVANSDGTLSITPTTGIVVASINLSNVNAWLANTSFSTTGTAGTGVLNNGFVINQTLNQTSTASSATFILNRINTALGTGFQDFMRFNTSSAIKLAIDSNGSVLFDRVTNNISQTQGIYASADGGATVSNGSGNGLGLFIGQFGSTARIISTAGAVTIGVNGAITSNVATSNSPMLRITGNKIASDSGAGIFYALVYSGGINQTVGTGASYGVNMSPTITSASGGWTSFFTNVNSTQHGFVSSGTAINNFVGRTTVGTTTDNGVDILQVTGNVILTTIGNGIKIKEGINARMGTGTLSAGAATIANTSVTATSRVHITPKTGGTFANIGQIVHDVLNDIVGTSFAVKSTNILDNSPFDWIMFEGV